MTRTNRQIILAERPQGMPDRNTFQYVEKEIQELNEGQILVKTLFVSVDPYMRGRMENQESYVAPFSLNEVIEGGAIGEVIESKSAEFKQGDIVSGMSGWQEYYIATESDVRKIDPSIVPIST